MDRPEVETMLKRARAALSERSTQITRLEAELVSVQAEVKRLEGLVTSLENYLSPEDVEGPKLTEAILATVRRYPPGLPAESLANKAIRLAPSKSPDPRRVAMVRIGQLVKEGKLVESGGRVRIAASA